MEILIQLTPAFAAIFVLIFLSAFFSSSEAAFFSLTMKDRCLLEEGGRFAQLALHISKNSEQLLNSILLGNLAVNLLTFTLSTVVTFQLQQSGRPDLAGMVAIGILFVVIVFCEMIPKSLGVLLPRTLVLLWSPPLYLVVYLLRPLLPTLQKINILSRRLFFPKFQPEDYLRVSDLERAVEMSRKDATLLKREQRVLQNIVMLSDIRAEELMRPRSLLKSFRPSMSPEDIVKSLHENLPRSGYCLITEPDSDEIAAILSLTRLTPQAMDSWADHFEPLVFVPWSVSAAEAFDLLERERGMVAVIVNEFGETIGILTKDDIIEMVFTREQGRSRLLLDRAELKRIGDYIWQVNELTSLRRLRRKFGFTFSDYSSLTVGGLLREILERFPKAGDVCRLEGFEFRVLHLTEEDGLIMHLVGPPESGGYKTRPIPSLKR